MAACSARPDAARAGCDAAVFTIVDAPPPAGAFRPPYTNVELDSFTVDQLNWQRLTNMPALDSAPAWATHEQRTERVWIDHKPYWSGRYIQPSNNMVAYGREIAQHFNEATLTLLMDHPQHEKEQTLINLVQIGIDFYGNILSAHASDGYTGSAHNAWTGDWGGAIGTGRNRRGRGVRGGRPPRRSGHTSIACCCQLPPDAGSRKRPATLARVPWGKVARGRWSAKGGGVRISRHSCRERGPAAFASGNEAHRRTGRRRRQGFLTAAQ